MNHLVFFIFIIQEFGFGLQLRCISPNMYWRMERQPVVEIVNHLKGFGLVNVEKSCKIVGRYWLTGGKVHQSTGGNLYV
jgi:hypothetical protein